MKRLQILVLLFIGISAFALIRPPQKKVNIIFDTDMGPDYDDVGAIALLHAYADSGKADILATIASTRYEGVGPVLSVINTYFNRADLPVGVPRSNALELRDWQRWSDTLTRKYPHRLKSNNEAMDAVELYRKVLASQPDGSVTIVTVGFLTNLAYLLRSNADNYSPLSGLDLVKKKVKNLISMAGKFPNGIEFNIEKDAASSKYVFENWPTPVLLSGYEIGQKIKTGLPLINNTAIQNSPIQDVFRISIPKARQDSIGRMSWDQTAVMVAVQGHQPYYRLQKGTMMVAEDGSNSWDTSGDKHAILIEEMNPRLVQQEIDRLMQHQPVRSATRK